MTAVRRLRADEAEKIRDLGGVSAFGRAENREAEASPPARDVNEAEVRVLLEALARGIA